LIGNRSGLRDVTIGMAGGNRGSPRAQEAALCRRRVVFAGSRVPALHEAFQPTQSGGRRALNGRSGSESGLHRAADSRNRLSEAPDNETVYRAERGMK
jgi:hypothetical protein